MSGKIEISRELLERLVGIANKSYDIEDAMRAGAQVRTLLAAPVVERQEPIMHITPQVLGMLKGELRMQSGGITFSESKPIGNWTVPLYTSPPAPVAVVLPERRPIDWMENRGDQYSEGWNACIDKAEDMNK